MNYRLSRNKRKKPPPLLLEMQSGVGEKKMQQPPARKSIFAFGALVFEEELSSL